MASRPNTYRFLYKLLDIQSDELDALHRQHLYRMSEVYGDQVQYPQFFFHTEKLISIPRDKMNQQRHDWWQKRIQNLKRSLNVPSIEVFKEKMGSKRVKFEVFVKKSHSVVLNGFSHDSTWTINEESGSYKKDHRDNDDHLLVMGAIPLLKGKSENFGLVDHTVHEQQWEYQAGGFVIECESDNADALWPMLSWFYSGEPCETKEIFKSRNEDLQWQAFEPLQVFQKKEPLDVITWSGDVDLVEDVNILEHQYLKVDSGANIKLGQGVSVRIYGRLRLQGTLTNPIRFMPKLEGEPWGAIVINAADVDDGLISHVSVSGGAGVESKQERIEGAFNVYACENIRVDHLKVFDCPSEDGMNAKFCEIWIENSWFENCNDGLDLDYCHAFLANSRFLRNRNDGLDLGSTKLKGNTILSEGSQDKGISVGSDSVVSLEKVTLKWNHIGLAVKDASRVECVSTTITSNKIGILSFGKAGRYQGYIPELSLEKVSFDANEMSAVIGPKVEVELSKTTVPKNNTSLKDLGIEISSFYQ